MKLLILDLDETLIYSDFCEPESFDFSFTLTGKTYWVQKRPHLDYFLQIVAQHYEIAVWSAARRDYVDIIVNYLFLPLQISPVFIFSGERCVHKWKTFPEYTFIKIKDLKKVWRRRFLVHGVNKRYKRENTFIVDDTRVTYCRNRGNAVRIQGYRGGTDRELLRLVVDLLMWKEIEDVRRR